MRMDWSPSDDNSAVCADCGEPIEDVGLQRTYLFAEDEVLCQACAMARGGVYDELHDRWVTPPNLHDLYPDGEKEFGPRGLAP
jgi:hypothetical protein